MKIAAGLVLAGLAFASVAHAGGSNFGVMPGSRAVGGRISEWQIPEPKYPRDPAPAPDGSVYFPIVDGNRIGNFNPQSQRFQMWEVRNGLRPSGLQVAANGTVIFTGIGNGTIAELDPASGEIREHSTTSANSKPYTLVMDPDGRSVWFTERNTGNVVRMARPGGALKPYHLGGEPYGISIDSRGNAWVSLITTDRVVKVDPVSGKTLEIAFASGSMPRHTAIGLNGSLWVALYGTGRLVQIDTAANKVVKEYPVPGGPNAGPYTVNTDAAGRVWVSEIQTDNIDLFDPQRETFRVFKLPTRNSGVRKAAVDAEGRYWYVGSHSGRLGLIE